MYDIIVRFPSEQVAKQFMGQMSDGFGEGFCDFSTSRQKEGTDGKKNEHYERVVEDGKPVCFVQEIFEF